MFFYKMSLKTNVTGQQQLAQLSQKLELHLVLNSGGFRHKFSHYPQKGGPTKAAMNFFACPKYQMMGNSRENNESNEQKRSPVFRGEGSSLFF